MGQVLYGVGQQVDFQVQVKSTEPLRLFVIKNALLFDTFLLTEGGETWQTIRFSDTPKVPGYYRLELHQVVKNPKHPGIQWRDYETFRAYSNPIWVKEP